MKIKPWELSVPWLIFPYKEYGGALFLGVKKPVVKAHGSSDEKLFEFTIKQAEQFVKNKAVDQLIEEFEKERSTVQKENAEETAVKE